MLEQPDNSILHHHFRFEELALMMKERLPVCRQGLLRPTWALKPTWAFGGLGVCKRVDSCAGVPPKILDGKFRGKHPEAHINLVQSCYNWQARRQAAEGIHGTEEEGTLSSLHSLAKGMGTPNSCRYCSPCCAQLASVGRHGFGKYWPQR